MDFQGHCDPAFNRVRDAFAENFREKREVGASVAVTVNERLLVDLWAGLANRATQSTLEPKHDRQRLFGE